MSSYLEQIRQLIAVQKLDETIIAVENEKQAAPQAVETVRAEYDKLHDQLDRQSGRMAALKEQESRIAAELEEEKLRLRKSMNKLMQVANSTEYQAMAREMDSMEKAQQTRTDELAAITEEIKTHSAAMQEMASRHDALKTELETKLNGLEEHLASTEKRLEQLHAERIAMTDAIAKPVLQRYEFIRRRLNPPIIVSVTDGICNGCHIAIPPQTFIDVQGGQKILNCPNCQRLICWDKHFPFMQDTDTKDSE